MPNSGDIASVYAREDAREDARKTRRAEDASKVAIPLRLVTSEQPTVHDLKDLAKAEQALRAARMLPRRHALRERKLDEASGRRDQVLARIEQRRVQSANAVAGVEAEQLERLRGGEVVEDDPRNTPGRRKRVEKDGMAEVLRLSKAAGTPAARKVFYRCWVAGMLYRHLFEAQYSGGVKSQLAGSAKGGDVMSALAAAHGEMLKKANAGRIVAQVDHMLASSPKGIREVRVLHQVAGLGRPLCELGAGGKQRHMWKLALLRALETVALVLKLP
jgi:hypothetical protein